MSAAVELVAGTFRLVPSRSAVTFSVKHLFGLGTVSGAVPVVSGVVEVSDGAARISAVLDAAAIDTGNKRRDKDLRSPKFLATEEFPTWEFTGAYSGVTIAGTLTAHGQPAACHLAVQRVERTGDRVDVVATTTVDRRAHGVTAAAA
ncbi:YceI family protein [Actinokineospora soli]|uniref:YceI family protein n=1 Tax=Actinokineospora soli TaxID=1048753 RepID=A0ABW2U0B9_9PSEU